MKRLISLAFWALSTLALVQPGFAQVVASGTSVLISGTHPVFTTAGATGANIQAFGHNTATVGTGGSMTITLGGANSTGGTLIVAAQQKSGTFGTGTISDSAGNTWVHKAVDIANSSVNSYNSWICQNCTGSAGDVITLTYQNSGNVAAVAFAVAGVGAASLDQYAAVAANASCSGAVCAGASVTTTIASEIVISPFGGGISSSANTWGSPTNSFILGDQDSSGGNSGIGWAYRVVSATGTYSTSLTLLGTSGFGYSSDTFSLH